MSAWQRWGRRWCRFNLVGAMGMALQLATLALFNRCLHGHYLVASAAAIELTLLHNFFWHTRYTWPGHRDRVTQLRQLMRFHLSNGLVSMLGNLALMRLLVDEAHLPLYISNLIAIVCCSMANFCLGNNWAFAEAAQDSPRCTEVNSQRQIHHSFRIADNKPKTRKMHPS